MPHLGHTKLIAVVVTDRVYMCALLKTRKEKHAGETPLLGMCENLSIYGLSLVLTFTRLDALKPPVISVSVASATTILIPSTTRSTTTDSAGFLEHATFWARHHIGRDEG